MRTRDRHHSREITFDLKVKNAIQLTYGQPLSAGDTRPLTAAFMCLTSQYPLPARFLERPYVAGGG